MDFGGIITGFCWIIDGLSLVVSLGNYHTNLARKWYEFEFYRNLKRGRK